MSLFLYNDVKNEKLTNNDWGLLIFMTIFGVVFLPLYILTGTHKK
jgi:hypothetical protein